MRGGSPPLVLLLAGLPGAGKSRLAERLAPLLEAAVLNRDTIRDSLFPPAALDYSAAQNKVATDAMLAVLDYLLEHKHFPAIVLDGKPFSRQSEIAAVADIVRRREARLLVVHCIAPPDVIDARLERDLVDPRNRRARRDPAKAARIRAEFEPILLPHIIIDTSTGTSDELASRVFAAINEFQKGP